MAEYYKRNKRKRNEIRKFIEIELGGDMDRYVRGLKRKGIEAELEVFGVSIGRKIEVERLRSIYRIILEGEIENEPDGY